MIKITETLRKLEKKYSSKKVFINEFKPNELVLFYVDAFNNKQHELCIELRKKWIGLTKLDKNLEIDFPSNDEVFYDSDSLFNYLTTLEKVEDTS